MNSVQKTIKQICEEENINFSLVSEDWITILEKDNKKKYIVGHKFGLNDHAAGQICDDKYALFEVLKHFNISVTKHHIVFNNYNINDVKKIFSDYNKDIVLKSNIGFGGNNVYHITNEKELFEILDKLFKKEYSVSIQPFYKIKNEYRTIIVNNEVVLFYGKKRPIVIGDGKKTIYQLLCEFNKSFFEKVSNKGVLNTVLEKNCVFEYSWQHNLSKGAIPFLEIDDKLKKEIQKLALEVANVLSLKFASVDIIELDNNELMVLEVNSGVTIDKFVKSIPNGYELAKNVYKKAINAMFE